MSRETGGRPSAGGEGSGSLLPRRAFLGSVARFLGAAATTCGAAPSGWARAPGKAPGSPAGGAAPADRFDPEYDRDLREVLIVYDQVAPDYLFREVVEILGCLPPGGTVRFLVSRPKEGEARRRLEEHGLRATLAVSEGEKLWGDWGRDIFQVGWRDGRTVLFVPLTKMAMARGELTRGFEVLRSLLGAGRDVRLIPLSFEGGNMAYDRIGGERVLFAGNSVLLDSAALYRRWFDRRLEVGECLDLLRTSFGVDRVVPLGRRADGVPISQASLLFHIDLACAVLPDAVAAVQRFEVPSSTGELRDDIRADLETCMGDEASVRRTEEILARKGIRATIPRKGSELQAAVDAGLRSELARLRDAEEELEAIRRTFRDLGYRVRDLPTDWRRVRRTQSYANVLVARDRLVLPIFPREGAGRARTILQPGGREIVEVLRSPVPEDYVLDGPNRENYRVYTTLFKDVRVVKDTFYLAGGNVHCVVGAIG
jgi:hypothetical protein